MLVIPLDPSCPVPLIPLNSVAFPAGVIANGQSTHTCTWSDLVWAAVTVGKRDLYDVVRHGQYSFFEIVYRAAILYANLREAPSGHIVRSDVYDGLDPTEKGATSYFLGLTAAKLLADAYLDVPWLMHLDVYRRRVAAMLTGRSRPDLIGQDTMGDWVVLESKGRTGSIDAAALNQAKVQAGQITTIGGAVPRIFVAVQAHFQGGRLSIDWHDPPSEANSRIDVEVSEADLLEAYYRPIERMLEERPELVERITINGEVFETVSVPDADLRIGLQADIRRRGVGRGELRRRSTRPDERTTKGSDGVLVQLGESWDAINMRLEPQSRSRLFVR